jgi:hypothetical protein
MNEIVKRNALGHPVAGGPSLNPGGRPRGAIQEVRELLGQHKQMFVDELLRLVHSDDEAIHWRRSKRGSIGSSERLPSPSPSMTARPKPARERQLGSCI